MDNRRITPLHPQPAYNNAINHKSDAEALIKEAIRLFDDGYIPTVRGACGAVGAVYTTTLHRLNGRPSARTARHKQSALTPEQELELIKSITNCAQWGLPMKHYHVKELAEALAGRKLGLCWVRRFIKRSPLSSIVAPKLDRSRAYNHDTETLEAFINLTRKVITSYNVLPENMWNMDEKGVLLGQAQAARVIIPALRSYRDRRKAFIQQPGSRELATAIECINAAGGSIAPLLVFKAAYHQQNWLGTDGERERWTYATSSKGWTDNDLGLAWLKIFERESRPHGVATPAAAADKTPVYRILFIDNHGSHVTAKFLRYCLDHQIVLIAFPPHCTHFFQPLDVGLFSPLQRYYSTAISDAVRWGNVVGVDKQLFLYYYSIARSKAFTTANIKSAWKAAGLWPLSARPAKLRFDAVATEKSARAGIDRAQNHARVAAQHHDAERDVALDKQPGWPWTPTKPAELKFMQFELLYTALQSTPAARRLSKLTKAFATIDAKLTIATTELQKYELYKVDKATNKRLQATGRLLGESDAIRIEAEEASKRALAAALSAKKAYEDGVYMPEVELAQTEFAIINPAEAGQLHAAFCHVFRVNYQGVSPRCVGMTWDGHSTACGGGRGGAWKLHNYVFEPALAQDAFYIDWAPK
ncbi:DDE-domain-containing protein [Dothidotthia symphoricarpi CBS 119687]|uniref:DDE-domain-containing protein n=1 Tax=Dothidotthia symphoricarpi CBS 119687 TaxID=1392245 RepID=A0A6A6A401_9PLEO|nr:DDE-domain-containing protein [Dothidotthia symphoricarpi CBS 119687]KAF2125905.1 DDE-domain-containing protein [Dothidotthia symphoricarpi CBS 119687]